MRIALGLEYDGTEFRGWQIQHEGRTIQRCLEAALRVVADHPVRAICAGRTDAGVHALGQVAHFDTVAGRTSRSWTLGLNSNLPTDISVRWARAVPGEFHARFSACARSYRYWILNSACRPALLRHRVWWVHRPLDARLMQDAAQALLGEHDFSAFRAAGCQSHTARRHVHSIAVRREKHLLCLEITANAFLHHMVRNIVGTLAVVGRGEAPPGWVSEVLASGDRRAAGMTAPPDGLYLTAVDYGDLLPQDGGGADPVRPSGRVAIG